MASRTLKPHDEVELVTTSMCISERMDLSCSVREKAHGLRDQVLLQQGLEGLEDCFPDMGGTSACHCMATMQWQLCLNKPTASWTMPFKPVDLGLITGRVLHGGLVHARTWGPGDLSTNSLHGLHGTILFLRSRA